MTTACMLVNCERLQLLFSSFGRAAKPALGRLYLAATIVSPWAFLTKKLPNSNCVFVGGRQKKAAFDAVFGVVPTPRSGRLSRRP